MKKKNIGLDQTAYHVNIAYRCIYLKILHNLFSINRN